MIIQYVDGVYEIIYLKELNFLQSREQVWKNFATERKTFLKQKNREENPKLATSKLKPDKNNATLKASQGFSFS